MDQNTIDKLASWAVGESGITLDNDDLAAVVPRVVYKARHEQNQYYEKLVSLYGEIPSDEEFRFFSKSLYTDIVDRNEPEAEKLLMDMVKDLMDPRKIFSSALKQACFEIEEF